LGTVGAGFFNGKNAIPVTQPAASFDLKLNDSAVVIHNVMQQKSNSPVQIDTD